MFKKVNKKTQNYNLHYILCFLNYIKNVIPLLLFFLFKLTLPFCSSLLYSINLFKFFTDIPVLPDIVSIDSSKPCSLIYELNVENSKLSLGLHLGHTLPFDT